MWTKFLLCAALACFASVAPAQHPAAAAADPAVADEKFAVDVNVVNVYFQVRERDKIKSGLTVNDFELFEDDRRQNISFFSNEIQPLTLAIMVDSSTSQSRVLAREAEIALRFLRQVVTPIDVGMVVGFDSRIQLQQKFTSDPELLSAALVRSSAGTSRESPELEAPSRARKSLTVRSTALHDAIVGVSNRYLAKRIGHKALLILTDGDDRGSHLNAGEAIKAAQLADVICYVLLLGDKNFTSSPAYKGQELMANLARSTGGRMIVVGKDEEKLQRSFDEISRDLRHYYSLGYVSDRKDMHGEFRKIKLKSRQGYHIQARRGYFAAPKHAEP